MRIIHLCDHPIHGSCYLWGNDKMEYRLGKVDTNFMKFDGYLLEEVEAKIKERGFTIIPWNWKAQ